MWQKLVKVQLCSIFILTQLNEAYSNSPFLIRSSTQRLHIPREIHINFPKILGMDDLQPHQHLYPNKGLQELSR